MTTVYVSATKADLAECREAIRTVCQRLNVVDVAMESYVTNGQVPLEKCLNDVARSDIYVGLFAWRYGFIPIGETNSITESEYRKAIELGKPCLIFLTEEKAPWPPNHIDRGESGARMMALREQLTGTHVTSFFRGPDDLAALATAALANLLSKDSPLPEPANRGLANTRAGASPATWHAYYHRLRQCYLGVELDALTPPPNAKTLQIPLTSVFLEPDAREDARPEMPRVGEHHDPRVAGSQWLVAPDGVDPADLAQLHASYQSKPSTRLFDLLTDPDHRTTVLLGDPGAGKSAVARYVALSLAHIHPEPRLAALDGHVPLLIELRAYIGLVNGGKCEDFIDYLDHRCRSDGLGIGKFELQAYLGDDGRALMIFDGLDEIFDPRRREEIANQIAAFAAKYPAVRVLVTARIVGYSRRTLSDAGFDHFTLEDLGEAQISEFLHRWYDRVIPDSPDEAKILRRRMLGAIRNSPAIRELAGNPLLLSILAIIGKKQELPKERWRLYDHAANVLVDYWDADRHLRDRHVGAEFLDTNDKKKLLRRLAFRMQSRQRGLDANYIEHDQLSLVFEDYLVERYNHPRPTAHQLANSMIEQFHQRNFILGRYGQHVYGFVHRTFLEFFYAQAVLRKFTEQDPEWPMERLKTLFEEHWADPSWREVLRLLSSALPVTVAANLIGLLTTEVNRPWPPEKFPEPPWNLALATQCLSELRDPSGAQAVAEALLRQIILLIEHGVAIEDRNTAQLIEAEILPAVRVLGTSWPGRHIYLDWFRRRGISVSWTTGSAFATRVAILLGTASERVEDLLEGTLGPVNDRRARLALIAGLAESAALPVTGGGAVAETRRARCRALLVGHARTDNHGSVRLAAVHALVAYFPIDVPLTELLADRARTDVYSEVRLMAVATLGRRRNMDDSTLTLLLQLAQGDPDGPVRRAAVEALVKHRAGDDDVRRLLTDRVRSDGNVGVFEVVARALVGPRGNNSHLRTLLAKRVRSDPSDPIRRAAARLLGSSFPDDYETRELLLDLVHESSDPGTRSAALHGLIGIDDDETALRALLIERLGQDDDASVRLLAQQTLVERYPDDPAIGQLLAATARDDRDATVRRAAVLELAAHLDGEDAFAVLVPRALEDKAAGVRLAAADSLAEHFGANAGTRETIIAQATQERDTIVRLAAVRILITFEADKEIHDHLLGKVRTDGDPQIIREAAAALIKWPAYQPLVFTSLRERAINDSYAGVRQAAIDILVASSVLDPVSSALFVDRARNDSDPAVFRVAAVALIEHFGGGPLVEELLVAHAGSDHWQFRMPAIELLGRHFGADARVRARLLDRARSDEDIAVRRAAVRVLGGELARQPEVRTLLQDLIMDPDWSLRCAAVHALGTHYGGDADLQALFMDLAHNHPDADFRRFMGQALTWLPSADPDQLPDITEIATAA